MSFLIWTERYYPDIGGLEKAIFRIHRELTSRGVRVKILTCSNSHLDSDHPDIVCFPKKGFLDRSIKYIAKYHLGIRCLYISRIFQRNETAHINSMKNLPDIPQVILRAPTTYNMQHVINYDERNIINSKVDIVITLNAESYEITKKLVNRPRVLMFHNSVDFPETSQCNYDGNFLFSGRITPSKNLFNLLKAWKIFLRQSSNCKRPLKIYGIPYDEDYFLKCISLANSMHNASYCGKYHPDDLSIIDNASFVIIPSFREGHSNLLNEALSCGTPAIISSIHGLLEHNNYDEKLIIKNPANLSDIVEALAYADSIKKANYFSISNKARKYANHCLSENKEANFLLELYENT